MIRQCHQPDDNPVGMVKMALLVRDMCAAYTR
jgi:hypothetical protein